MARLNFEQDLVMIYRFRDGNKVHYEIKCDILDACNGAEEDLKDFNAIVKIEIWRKVSSEIALKEFEFVKRD